MSYYRWAIFFLGVFEVLSAAPASAASVGEVLKKIQNLTPAQRRSALEEGAKSERQVVIYTSVSLTDYPKILAAFEQSYPYIKTNAFRSTPSGVVRRVDTEAKAGRHAVDVVATGTASIRNVTAARCSVVTKGASMPDRELT